MINRKELVREISRRTGFAQKDVDKVVTMTFIAIRQSLISGVSVLIRGFGKFELSHRQAKKARDIGRDKQIIIPECYVPSFKAAPKFVEQVKESNDYKIV